MANAASHKWENGVLVERAIETNRWRVAPDGSELADKEEVEPKATKKYKAPTTKRVAVSENKSAAKKAADK